MGTIAGIIATWVASHLGGMAVGGLLGKQEMAGFGLKTALRGAKRVVERRAERRAQQARDETRDWLDVATVVDDPDDDTAETVTPVTRAKAVRKKVKRS